MNETAEPIKLKELTKTEKILITTSFYWYFALGIGIPTVSLALMKMVNENIIASANTVSTLLSCIVIYITAHYTMRRNFFTIFKILTISTDLLMLALTIYSPGVIVYWMYFVVAEVITQFDNTTTGTIMLNFFPNHKRRVDFDVTEKRYTVICSLLGSSLAIFLNMDLWLAMAILVSAFSIMNSKDIYMGLKYLKD